MIVNFPVLTKMVIDSAELAAYVYTCVPVLRLERDCL